MNDIICQQCEYREHLLHNAEARQASALSLYEIYYKQCHALTKGIKRLHRQIARLKKQIAKVSQPNAPREMNAAVTQETVPSVPPVPAAPFTSKLPCSKEQIYEQLSGLRQGFYRDVLHQALEAITFEQLFDVVTKQCTMLKKELGEAWKACEAEKARAEKYEVELTEVNRENSDLRHDIARSITRNSELLAELATARQEERDRIALVFDSMSHTGGMHLAAEIVRALVD